MLKQVNSSARMRLLIPFDKAGFISRIRVEGKVFSEEYTPDGILCDAMVDIKLFSQAEKYIAM